MAALNPLEDAVPSRGWAARRTNRRRFVLLCYLVLVLGTIVTGGPGYDGMSPLTYVLGLAAVAAACAGLLWIGARFRVDRADRELDERQRAVRDRAHTLAYYWIMAFFLLASASELFLRRGVFASLSGTEGPHFLVWALLCCLPSSIAAWIEPDPPL